MPLSVHIMARSDEHRAFVVEEFIQNGGLPMATQHSQQTEFRLLVSK
jgi:hypothetical protein